MNDSGNANTSNIATTRGGAGTTTMFTTTTSSNHHHTITTTTTTNNCTNMMINRTTSPSSGQHDETRYRHCFDEILAAASNSPDTICASLFELSTSSGTSRSSADVKSGTKPPLTELSLPNKITTTSSAEARPYQNGDTCLLDQGVGVYYSKPLLSPPSYKYGNLSAITATGFKTSSSSSLNILADLAQREVSLLRYNKRNTTTIC